MNIHEDSMPLRFTPDGLDEASIDLLIEQSYGQVSDVPVGLLADVAEPRPVSRRTDQSPKDEAAA